jgi:hypothetical protein
MRVWAAPFTYISLREFDSFNHISFFFNIFIWVVEPPTRRWRNKVFKIFFQLSCEALGPLDLLVVFHTRRDGELLGWLVMFCAG